MTQLLFFWLAAPASIATGLFLFKSAAVTFILFHGVVCLLIPFVDLAVIRGYRADRIALYLGFENLRRNILPALLAGISLCAAVFLFFVLLQGRIMDLSAVQTLLLEWGIHPSDTLWFFSVMVVLNSVVEEIYWRGFIFSRLREHVNPGMTVFLSSIFYASYHGMTTGALFTPVYAVICTTAVFLGGTFWGYMRLRRNTVWYGVVTHLMVDFGIMLVYLKYFA